MEIEVSNLSHVARNHVLFSNSQDIIMAWSAQSEANHVLNLETTAAKGADQIRAQMRGLITASVVRKFFSTELIFYNVSLS